MTGVVVFARSHRRRIQSLNALATDLDEENQGVRESLMILFQSPGGVRVIRETRPRIVMGIAFLSSVHLTCRGQGR